MHSAVKQAPKLVRLWTAVRSQRLLDRRDDADHIAYQAAVAFPDGLAAHDFYDSQVSEWAKCDDRRVDLHGAGDPQAHYWSLSKATDDGGILTITRMEEESALGWSCQRALTAGNNVVVDVSACMHHVDDQGIQIARQIAQKIAQR
ncbi:sensor domain-containing protein [Mycolicibacterium lutetiense]